MKLVSKGKEKTEKFCQFLHYNKLNFRYFIFFLFFITACGKKLPENNFDTKAWQQDPKACHNSRLALLPELEKVKQNLYGLRESQIQELLGKPEATTLTDQSERLYLYYIEPGPQCSYESFLSSANKLQVRMNAMGLVTEINYEQPLKK